MYSQKGELDFVYQNEIWFDNVYRKNCVTHGGKFHSDEIFATVILSKILTNIKLIRVNEVTDSMRESIANKLVYDIGGGEFDHHQAGGNGQRDNGVKYASCGLIWKSYGINYLEKCNVKIRGKSKRRN